MKPYIWLNVKTGGHGSTQERQPAFRTKSISHHLVVENGVVVEHNPFTMPADIEKILRNDPEVWQHFCNFPEAYQLIRISNIDQARTCPDLFAKRLNYFIKMTKQNKQFGSKV